MTNPLYQPVRDFEAMLSEYTGAPHVVAVDSCMSALYLAMARRLTTTGYRHVPIIPKHTYPCVAQMVRFECESIAFRDSQIIIDNDGYLSGYYEISPYNVWDSALSFYKGMWYDFLKRSFVCLSFTGPRKYLKLPKAGAILCGNEEDAEWFKRARFGGRREMPYHEDTFDWYGPGFNMYLLPEIAIQGIRALQHHIAEWGTERCPDLALPYPDLSQMPAFK